METWSCYSNPPQSLLELGIACMGAGEFIGASVGFENRRLRTYAAVLVSQGRGWFETAALGRVKVVAPSVIWIAPGEKHGYGPLGEGWTEHWVLFAGDLSRSLSEFAMAPSQSSTVDIGLVPARLASTFQELRAYLVDGSDAGSLRAAATCFLWTATLATANLPTRSTGVVDAFIRSSARRMSMYQRARHLRVSPSHLRAATLEATGLSPLQLLIESRLGLAQSLLAETTLEVGAIARSVGFDDAAYFSRAFRERRGMSPSAFRHEQRRSIAKGDDARA